MFVPLHLRKINGGYGARPDHTWNLIIRNTRKIGVCRMAEQP